MLTTIKRGINKIRTFHYVFLWLVLFVISLTVPTFSWITAVFAGLTFLFSVLFLVESVFFVVDPYRAQLALIARWFPITYAGLIRRKHTLPDQDFAHELLVDIWSIYPNKVRPVMAFRACWLFFRYVLFIGFFSLESTFVSKTVPGVFEGLNQDSSILQHFYFNLASIVSIGDATSFSANQHYPLGKLHLIALWLSGFWFLLIAAGFYVKLLRPSLEDFQDVMKKLVGCEIADPFDWLLENNYLTAPLNSTGSSVVTEHVDQVDDGDGGKKQKSSKLRPELL